MAKVFIGVGSNIDKERHIATVISEFEETFSVVAVSPIYETKAEGFDGEDFYNLVVAIETELTPSQLYQILRQIEADHGRERIGENQFISRTLDLDQLLYDDLVFDDGAVSVPNADIIQYAFVLKPLADIASELVHPILNEPLAQLWQRFVKTNINMREITLNVSATKTSAVRSN